MCTLEREHGGDAILLDLGTVGVANEAFQSTAGVAESQRRVRKSNRDAPRATNLYYVLVWEIL